MKSSRCFGRAVLSLFFFQGLLILVSWLMTAAMPELPLHSLLSAEGARWFFGRFSDNLSSPLLLWIVLILIAWGAVRESGLIDAVKSVRFNRPLRYQNRQALQLTIILLILMVIAIVLLTATPHAVLLSITGHLFPSSFSESLIPILSFISIVCSLVYGGVSGVVRTWDSFLRVLTVGIVRGAPLFILYILLAQLLYSLSFVFYSLEF